MDVDIPPCPDCDEPQEVLKATDASMTLKCPECCEVRTISVPKLRKRTVQLIISHGAESSRTQMEVVTTDDIEVGMEFDHDGRRLMVTALEGTGEARSRSMAGKDVQAIHAKHFDTVRLKFTLNEGPTTQSLATEVEPDEPVHIGQVWDVDGRSVLVKSIKTDLNRTLRRGGIAARHVRRVFCDPFDKKP